MIDTIKDVLTWIENLDPDFVLNQLISILTILSVYFFPSMVVWLKAPPAALNKHLGLTALDYFREEIILSCINTFLGWTIVGWFYVLYRAYLRKKK